ncbi:ATP-grasp domain-containing protein [Oceanobacillus halotolerans]|uniref:ATP-grasp domain-containing protein n=1 Tax=Oceanobacillus halotolerans TaxID=2663380 RepID=UPI001CF78AF4|nr:ATP-grasp domain-containing protein [Oceanobacillus halotolerans]
MTKTGWLIYRKEDAKQNEGFIQWFMDEASAIDISIELVYREQVQIGIMNQKLSILKDGESTSFPNFAIVRTIDPLLSSHLENIGITVYNSSYVASICNHKAMTHQEVMKLHIPMVNTIFTTKDTISPAAPPIEYPFVIKDVHSRGGKHVFYVNNERVLKESLMKITSQDILIQDCKVQLGKDVRVFVIGKEIIAAVLRESQTDFRANFKLGGQASIYHLSSSEKQMIQKIVKHFDFGMVGIDFLINHDGTLLFNEIEDVVGSRTLSAVSDINIVKQYLHYIKDDLIK